MKPERASGVGKWSWNIYQPNGKKFGFAVNRDWAEYYVDREVGQGKAKDDYNTFRNLGNAIGHARKLYGDNQKEFEACLHRLGWKPEVIAKAVKRIWPAAKAKDGTWKKMSLEAWKSAVKQAAQDKVEFIKVGGNEVEAWVRGITGDAMFGKYRLDDGYCIVHSVPHQGRLGARDQVGAHVMPV